jgi:hypothetical protein
MVIIKDGQLMQHDAEQTGHYFGVVAASKFVTRSIEKPLKKRVFSPFPEVIWC